jgi:hypothetical protein
MATVRLDLTFFLAIDVLALLVLTPALLATCFFATALALEAFCAALTLQEPSAKTAIKTRSLIRNICLFMVVFAIGLAKGGNTPVGLLQMEQSVIKKVTLYQALAQQT